MTWRTGRRILHMPQVLDLWLPRLTVPQWGAFPAGESQHQQAGACWGPTSGRFLTAFPILAVPYGARIVSTNGLEPLVPRAHFQDFRGTGLSCSAPASSLPAQPFRFRPLEPSVLGGPTASRARGRRVRCVAQIRQIRWTLPPPTGNLPTWSSLPVYLSAQTPVAEVCSRSGSVAPLGLEPESACSGAYRCP